MIDFYLIVKKCTPFFIKRIFNLWIEDKEKELAASKKLEEITNTKRKAKAIAKSIYQSGSLPAHFDDAIEDFKKKLPYDDEDLLELLRIRKVYIQKRPAAKKKPAARKVLHRK